MMESVIFPLFRIPVTPRLLALAVIAVLLAGCAGTREIKPKPLVRHPDFSAVARYALSLQGYPYRYGAESPQEGFDCSGLVQYVFGQYGVRLPRTDYQMAHAATPVDSRNRRPGDLVFFNTTGQPYSHVGIYIGNDAFVHSSSVKGKVIVSSLGRPYWWERFLGVRRLKLPDNASVSARAEGHELNHHR